MINIVLALILIISILTDLRNRKILNIVTLPAIISGFIYHIFTSGLEGFFFSGQGFLLGLGLLFIPFLMGGVGAGDVKLLAAVGAWKGALFIFYTGIYAGIIGGIIALLILLKRRELIFTLKRMLFSVLFWKSANGALLAKDDKQGSISIPYAIPIALGTLFTFLMETYL
ncbi:prepilin peptidase [Paenisporosarcina sp. TG20]|uniref:A24 family peptidase n=1 Tax=Paenisporosarcina sp. TG20 TaxID=1211706 RepID=UPI000310D625|nr:A24 family peptidase [Paenisporosarcina sp. TG20]